MRFIVTEDGPNKIIKTWNNKKEIGTITIEGGVLTVIMIPQNLGVKHIANVNLTLPNPTQDELTSTIAGMIKFIMTQKKPGKAKSDDTQEVLGLKPPDRPKK